MFRRFGSSRNNLPFILLGSSFTLLILSFINLISKFSSEDNSYQSVEHIPRVDYLPVAQLKYHKNVENGDLEAVDQPEESKLMKKVKILCLIMTRPKYFETRAIAVKSTWGKRCDKLIFMSSVTNSSLPSIDLKLGDTDEILWRKTKTAFQYCYDHYIKEFDWFLKAGDNTFVVIENLKYVLNIYDPEQDGIHFGYKMKFDDTIFISGGAGCVLSKKALELFVEKGLPDKTKCSEADDVYYDVEFSKCLANVGVIAGDSRDSHGHERFFYYPPEVHVNIIDPNSWLLRQGYYPYKNGPEHCSYLPILFHNVDVNLMNKLEYLFYHAHVFGLKFKDRIRPALPPDKNSIPRRMLEYQE